MLTFLRNIRRSFIESGSARKYLLYAIGEVLLVMIGILLALQINNWNEWRKDRVLERDSYLNLLDILRQDSVELAYIIKNQTTSIQSHLKVISTDPAHFMQTFGEEDLKLCIANVMRGGLSFFPKYGVYNAILANTGLNILRSEEIRSKLINFYDYQCKKYENIDAVVDEKFANGMQNVILERMNLFIEVDFSIITGIDLPRINEVFDEWVIQCKKNYWFLMFSRNSLIEIEQSANELIQLIQREIQ